MRSLLVLGLTEEMTARDAANVLLPQIGSRTLRAFDMRHGWAGQKGCGPWQRSMRSRRCCRSWEAPAEFRRVGGPLCTPRGPPSCLKSLVAVRRLRDPQCTWELWPSVGGMSSSCLPFVGVRSAPESQEPLFLDTADALCGSGGKLAVSDPVSVFGEPRCTQRYQSIRLWRFGAALPCDGETLRGPVEVAERITRSKAAWVRAPSLVPRYLGATLASPNRTQENSCQQMTWSMGLQEARLQKDLLSPIEVRHSLNRETLHT